MTRASRDDDHRGDGGGWRKDRVLERTEPEHAHARLPRRNACALERVTVDDEAAADDEHAESRGDDRACTSEPDLGSAFDARDLAVRDDVTEIRGDLHAERDRKPDPVHVIADVEDALEAGRPRDADQRGPGEHRADPDQDRVLQGVPLQMRQRPEILLELHYRYVCRSRQTRNMAKPAQASTPMKPSSS